jgi:hypothetical protein
MSKRIPERLRAPAIMATGGAAVIIVVGTSHGWSSARAGVPAVVLLSVGYYLWAGKDTDSGAVVRRQTDERQAALRLKVQALVGQVMSLAAVVTYLVAVSTKVMLWPFAILVCLPAATFAAGWLIYREHGDG